MPRIAFGGSRKTQTPQKSGFTDCMFEDCGNRRMRARPAMPHRILDIQKHAAVFRPPIIRTSAGMISTGQSGAHNLKAGLSRRIR
jgi:hypothetical protein